MKKIKAYTLMEMLVVMSIMIIILAIGLSSYAAYIETTKYNQDVSNLQQDILNMQRASMLLKKEKDDGWLYGVGIDFGGLINGEGTYRFFKWCSGVDNFGYPRTTGKYPNYNETFDTSYGIPVDAPPINYNSSSCASLVDNDPKTWPNGGLVLFSGGYTISRLNLGEDVSISGGRFLLFESVTGRAFIFDDNEAGFFFWEPNGDIVEPPNNLVITFNKRRGAVNNLTIENLSGRTKLSVVNP